MRMMMTVRIPVEAGNAALKNGKLGETIKNFTEKWKPEAAYFTPNNGERSAMMVFDLPDTSLIPVITEPFFMNLEADVEFAPVMNTEDLMKGLSQLK